MKQEMEITINQLLKENNNLFQSKEMLRNQNRNLRKAPKAAAEAAVAVIPLGSLGANTSSERQKHLVNKLQEDGHIISDKVYGIMFSVDLEDFFDTKPHNKRNAREVVKRLEKWAPHVNKGSGVLHLYAGIDSCQAYERTVLAYWVGANGLVVGVTENWLEQDKISKNYAHVLAPGTLSLMLISDVSQFPDNGKQFDAMFVYFLGEAMALINRLKLGGIIYCYHSSQIHKKSSETKVLPVVA